jgi:thiamine biosynthesis lipoprotein
LPEPELFNPAKAAVGYQFLRLDEMAHTAQLLKPNMRLDLGGIAKGYAAEEALAVVRKHGISRALVRASGDIAAGDPPPGEAGWLVGIAPLDPDETPSRFVSLANRAVSTSGDSRQHLEIDGKRYSHIVDPRTGLGVLGRSSVTVIAPRGIAADSLATAVSILGPDKGLALIAKYKDTALLMVAEDAEGNAREVTSPNFARFEAPPTKE